jgi:hypothetical protein
MVWSVNEARKKGIAIDAAKAELWNRWALENGLQRAVYYKLSDKSPAALKDAGMPEADVAKLKPLTNKVFVFESEFRTELRKLLGEDGLKSHAERVLKAAAMEKQGGAGGGTNNQYTALLLAGVPDAIPDAGAARKTLVDGLVKAQLKDGSWTPASQFLAQQRPAAESKEIVTLWTMLALAEVPDLPESAVKTLTKAREWLKSVKPAVNTDTLLLRAMLASKDGEKAKLKDSVDKLLKLQHDDGGWGWQAERSDSDPLTTGQVLYALGYIDRKSFEPAIQKARQYLLKTQNDKGYWPVTNQLFSTSKKEDHKAGDAIYTYWATGWAVLGLAQTLGD